MTEQYFQKSTVYFLLQKPTIFTKRRFPVALLEDVWRGLADRQLQISGASETPREAMRVMRRAGAETSGSNGSLDVPGHTINRSNGLGQPRQVLLNTGQRMEAKRRGNVLCCHQALGN